MHTTQQFVNELLDLFILIMNKSGDKIIAGDLNIHFLSEIEADGKQL